MWAGKPVCLKRAVLVVCFLGVSWPLQAQTPYGLSARQTLPWVVSQRDDRGEIWGTEVNIHNPSPLSITVWPTYKGAVMTPTPGSTSCNPVVVGPRNTVEFPLGVVCPLNPGLNFGRLELTTLKAGGMEVPSDSIFLANGRVSRQGQFFFTVEGFPEGYLSGNKFAAVTGLKSGISHGSQWQTFCAASGLNDATAVVVHLFDGSGNMIGGPAGAPLDPPSGIEMQTFPDVFTAVGAPPGTYTNVTARFSSFVPNAGIFGFCLIVNQSSGERAFAIAKYLDNNDDGRQHATSVSKTAYGADFAVVSEIDPGYAMIAGSNLHVAYFQHPDRIHCTVTWSSPHSTFDQVQMRLIDPAGNVVAGGAHRNEFWFDLGEKPQHADGRNSRWLIEVGPDRVYFGDCSLPLLRYVCPGKAELTPYTLTCSSGNGHDQLDMIGHCRMSCTKDNSKEGLCAFDTPFAPVLCWQ